jgi:flagellar basal-body rod protein FlgC
VDLFRAFDVSASGLAAQRARMETISENIANADTAVTAGGQPYRRKFVVLERAAGPQTSNTAMSGALPDGGVRVRGVAESSEAFRRVYQPGHPQAGPDGYVELPNVNPLNEMLDMMSATRAYEANASAFQATKSMGQKLLELLR